MSSADDREIVFAAAKPFLNAVDKKIRLNAKGRQADQGAAFRP
jgi:hypothetical protein